jgi:hypothetical protein
MFKVSRARAASEQTYNQVFRRFVMSSQNRPISPDQAPDTARVYERAKPEAESGAGRLDNNKFKPHDRPDAAERLVNDKIPSRQINAEDVVDQQKAAKKK